MRLARLAVTVAAVVAVAVGSSPEAAAAPAPASDASAPAPTPTPSPTTTPSAKATAKATATAKAKAKATAKARARAKARAKAKAARAKRGKGKRGPPGSNMPPGWAWPPTKAMVATGEACTRKLDELGITWEPAEPEGRIVTPIVVPAMTLGGLELISVYRKGPHTMDCHLALGLATYGPQIVALGVKQLQFSSIYRNTKVRAHGQTKNMLSRHALGLAIDVRSFVDDAGRVAIVETDYNAADTLLLSIEQVVNDSGGFRTVLTPRNDPTSHYDHFHLEIRVEYPKPAGKKPAT